MKKIYSIMLAALAVCAVSCQEGPLESQTPEAGETLTFTASLEGATKTAFDAAGEKVEWVAGDFIYVYDQNGNAIKSNELTEGGSQATFTVTGSFGANPTAVYGTIKENKVVFPEEQAAVAGSFQPDAAVMVAQATGKNLEFKNVASLLKFTIGEDNVKDITIWGLDENRVPVQLAGTGEVTYNEGAPTISFTEPKAFARLSGDFVKDQTYYMAIRPSTFSEFVVEINGRTAKVYKKYDQKGNVTFSRSYKKDMGILTTPVCTYALEGWFGYNNEWTRREFGDCGKYWVIPNIYFDQNDEFLFRAGGEWLKGGNVWDNWCVPGGSSNNMKQTVAGASFDVYAKKDDTKNFIILPAGAPVPEENIAAKEYTVKIHVNTANLGEKNCLHFWTSGTTLINGNDNIQGATVHDGWLTWEVKFSTGYLQQAAGLLVKKNGSWDIKTADSPLFFIENEMFFEVNKDNVPVKVAAPSDFK